MSPPPVTFKNRVRYQLGSALSRLPAPLQLRLSGKEQLILDGQALAPDLQLILAVRERMGWVPFHVQEPQRARRGFLKETVAFEGSKPSVGGVRDLVLEREGRSLNARHYAPADAGGPHPLLVFFHGGGMVLGDLDTHDAPCRFLCHHSGVHVLSIDYRLAPEHPFPASIQDAKLAYDWALAHAAELGADPARVAVGGDSAGGNLAAVVSQLCATAGTPAPFLQLLIYPATDRTGHYPSLKLFSDGYLFSAADGEWCMKHYLAGSTGEAHDPLVSPLLAKSLAGLPPALVVTAGFDILRDEGEAYAAALQAAGTPAVLRRMTGLVHGFINLTGVSPTSRTAMIELGGALRAMVASRPIAQARTSSQTHHAGAATAPGTVSRKGAAA